MLNNKKLLRERCNIFGISWTHLVKSHFFSEDSRSPKKKEQKKPKLNF